MKILAIETSASICGLTYREDGKNIASIEREAKRKHAEVLPDYYLRLKEKTRFILSELDGIAISIGPGSFTGLRVGLSFAKGLAFSHGLPLIPVPTLATLSQATGENGFHGILFYSHGDKVYHQSFEHGGNTTLPKFEAKMDEWSQAIKQYSPDTRLFHCGCHSLLSEKNEILEIQVSSKHVALLAETNFEAWHIKDPKMLVPDYISSFNFGKAK